MSFVQPRFKEPKGPKTIPQGVRRKVMARAGGVCEARIHGTCNGSADHLHHVRRRAQGGQNTYTNLKVVCFACHRKIHEHPEWAAAHGLLILSRDPLSSAVTKVEKC